MSFAFGVLKSQVIFTAAIDSAAGERIGHASRCFLVPGPRIHFAALCSATAKARRLAAYSGSVGFEKSLVGLRAN